MEEEGIVRGILSKKTQPVFTQRMQDAKKTTRNTE